VHLPRPLQSKSLRHPLNAAIKKLKRICQKINKLKESKIMLLNRDKIFCMNEWSKEVNFLPSTFIAIKNRERNRNKV
jgi:hypothetical protein